MNAGDKIGDLTIIGLLDHRAYGGRPRGFYLCRCVCGRTEELFNITINRRRKCSVCARGPCIVCGNSITDITRSNCCSDQCRHEKIKSIQNKSYARRATPEFNKKRHEKTLEKMSDPDYAGHVRKIRRAANRRYRNTPHGKTVISDYQKNRWVKNKESIMAARTGRIKNMTDDEYVEWRRRSRRYQRLSKKRHREFLNENPEMKREYTQRYREWLRKHKNERALNEMFNVGRILTEKLNDTDTEN